MTYKAHVQAHYREMTHYLDRVVWPPLRDSFGLVLILIVIGPITLIAFSAAGIDRVLGWPCPPPPTGPPPGPGPYR